MDSVHNLSSVSPAALEAKENQNKKFRKKGISLAVFSGMCYGMYTTFLMLGQSKGVWADWYGANIAGLSAFTIVYILGALGSGINDTCSGIWTLILTGIRGKLGDFARSVKTKPGAVVMASAIIGGPIASSCYVIALQLAGSMIIPITTIYPAIGAVIARILYKQKLTPRMCFGIGLCVTATLMIGSTSLAGDAKEGMLLGCLIAFFAAICWATEGVVVGYTTTIIDYEIGIAIRQCVSGFSNLCILIPILCLLDGGENLYGTIVGGALTSFPAMKFFIISGFISIFAYSLWYKGNNMCGAALGMAANSAYSFWGPLFCWLILGIALGQPGWELPPIVWAGAVVMFLGILFIAVNPFKYFHSRKEKRE